MDGNGRRRGCSPSGASSRDWRIPVDTLLQRANVGTRSKAHPPLKNPHRPHRLSLCTSWWAARACTTGGLYMGASWGLRKLWAPLTRHAQLPLACLRRGKRRQSGSSLAQKTHPRAGLDLSQAPPTSRICLTVSWRIIAHHTLSPHADSHIAAVFAAPSLLSITFFLALA